MVFTLWKTSWGWIGLAGGSKGLKRLVLPQVSPARTKELLAAAPGPQLQDSSYFADFGQIISRYLEGEEVDLSYPVDLSGLTDFTCQVLQATRQIGFGQVWSYAGVARYLGRDRAARAVGRALSSNPVPLVIPCHRVIRQDGLSGGFSAGGSALKEKLLRLEGLDTAKLISYLS